jgi:bifunctional non-homologous end joining protein LigD
VPPTTAPHPPSGEPWLHEIKHDGFRVIARKDGERVKLYSRPGNDLTYRFPLIVEGLARLGSRSCIIDGEAVACGDDGIALFEHIRYRRFDSSVFMYAFDLIELNGDDLRREPLEWRKAGSGVQLNEHLEAEGPLVFEHACRMGLEGIVSMQDPARSRARASTIKGKRGQIVPGTAVELHPLAILARLSTI